MDRINCPHCGVEILFNEEGRPYVKDYFNEVFGHKAGEKPKRYEGVDGRWYCVGCGRVDDQCLCSIEKAIDKEAK